MLALDSTDFRGRFDPCVAIRWRLLCHFAAGLQVGCYPTGIANCILFFAELNIKTSTPQMLICSTCPKKLFDPRMAMVFPPLLFVRVRATRGWNTRVALWQHSSRCLAPMSNRQMIERQRTRGRRPTISRFLHNYSLKPTRICGGG